MLQPLGFVVLVFRQSEFPIFDNSAVFTSILAILRELGVLPMFRVRTSQQNRMVDVFEGKKGFQTILTEFSDLFWQNVFRLQQQFTRVRDAILLTQHFLTRGIQLPRNKS